MHGDVGEGKAQSWVLGSAEGCIPPIVSCSYLFIQYRLIVTVSGDRVEVKGSSYCGTTPWYIGLATLHPIGVLYRCQMYGFPLYTPKARAK